MKSKFDAYSKTLSSWHVQSFRDIQQKINHLASHLPGIRYIKDKTKFLQRLACKAEIFGAQRAAKAKFLKHDVYNTRLCYARTSVQLLTNLISVIQKEDGSVPTKTEDI